MYMLQASAAICIYAGALLDPDDLPGLAHYLEHSKSTIHMKFTQMFPWIAKLVKSLTAPRRMFTHSCKGPRFNA